MLETGATGSISPGSQALWFSFLPQEKRQSESAQFTDHPHNPSTRWEGRWHVSNRMQAHMEMHSGLKITSTLLSVNPEHSIALAFITLYSDSGPTRRQVHRGPCTSAPAHALGRGVGPNSQSLAKSVPAAQPGGWPWVLDARGVA